MTSAPCEDPDQEQPFLAHLMELRDRLLHMVVAVVLVFLVLFPFANDIYTLIAEPIRAKLPEGSVMIATQVASPFLTPFKLALIAAVFLAMPYLLFQLWGFVAPGLYQHEKRFALPLLVASIVLFYLGMVFAYFVVFPLVFAFFSSVTPQGVAQMPDITFYLDFVLKLFFAFGIAFEIPIATILVVAMSITTPEQLASKRPYIIVGVFVVGMLLTPPDVISQTLLAIPMWMLYEAGIFFSRFFVKSEEEPEDPDPEPADSLPPDEPSSPPGEGLGMQPVPEAPRGGGDPVGKEIAGGDFSDPDRFRPMTEEEMDAELDAIEREEKDPMDALLETVMTLREREDENGARKLLYRVLEAGDESQRRTARNILDQMDRP